jgi:hypothetical protein
LDSELQIEEEALRVQKRAYGEELQNIQKYYEMLELRNELKEKNWCNKQLGKEWKIAC